TSTTLASWRDEGVLAEAQPIAIGDAEGALLPSTVWVAADGTPVWGASAEGRAPTSRVVRSIKQAITRNEATLTPGDGSVVAVDDLVCSLFALVAERLRERRPDALDAETIRLGCPAMWVKRQRQRLASLARRGGVLTDVDTMIDEPIAAGLTWIAERNLQSGR